MFQTSKTYRLAREGQRRVTAQPIYLTAGVCGKQGGIYVKNSEILVIFFVYLAGVANVDVCVCGVIPHRPAPGSGFFTHPGGLLITQGVY